MMWECTDPQKYISNKNAPNYNPLAKPTDPEYQSVCASDGEGYVIALTMTFSLMVNIWIRLMSACATCGCFQGDGKLSKGREAAEGKYIHG